VPHPPSLQNIFKEVRDDVGAPIPASGNLEGWARQGVLLLNAMLTVRAHEAASHSKIGWQRFTDAAIRRLSEWREGLVFLLWGRFAQDKAALIDRSRHHILTAPHPSPLSAHRGFFGCRHFSQANERLERGGVAPVDWDLTRGG
jgi:uracil-DNA glycosylase